MSSRVFGEVFYTADLSTTGISQKLIVAENTFALVLRTWLIFFNNPAFTSLQMHIYAERDGLIGPPLYSSAAVLKAEVLTNTHGMKDIPFVFNSPNGVTLSALANYFVVLSAVGYTGDDSSHIAWARGFPDGLVNTTIHFESINSQPFNITMIGADIS